ncbi:hypothetical protein [Methanolobus halotolerans]|nr:hypothetical protein [Methanolobus halotolerans]
MNSGPRKCSSTSSCGILMHAQAERKTTMFDILAPFPSMAEAIGKAM